MGSRSHPRRVLTLQAILLQGLGHVGTPLQFEEVPTEVEAETEDRAPALPKKPLSMAETVPVPSGQAVPDYTLPPPGGVPQSSKEGSDPVGSVRALELQLQLRKMEIEDRQFKAQQEEKLCQRQYEAQERAKEREERAKERENEERQRQEQAKERDKEREFELRRLELQRPQAPPVAARRDGPTSLQEVGPFLRAATGGA